MSRLNDEEVDKIAKRENAMKYKGYNKCDNCGEMFKPNANDPQQFVCDDCFNRALEKN